MSLTGEVGTVYSIQYASDLSQTNQWVDRTLLQAQGASNVWSDPSAPTPGQRFYRAVSVPAPADANLVFIQPGTFTMGSPTNEVDRDPNEGPQTVVTISRGFWMGRYLVTQGDYAAVLGGSPAGDPNLPGGASYHDTTNYCAVRTAQELVAGLIPTNCVYRLPTEAEWEYACRAGTTTRFYYGDDLDYTELANYAWYYPYSGGAPHDVGLLIPNAWGLYDMAGNAWERCQDYYYYPGGSVTDPQGGGGGLYGGAERGGGPNASAHSCRSAHRYSGNTGGIGFRVVLAPAR